MRLISLELEKKSYVALSFERACRWVSVLNAAPVFAPVAYVPHVAHLDQLIRSMEDAGRALDAGLAQVGDAALADALGTLGALYAELAPDASSEASGQLELLYDTCIRALGEAYGGGNDALLAAVSVLRSLRSAMTGTQSAVMRRAA
jgi:flagellin-specific chaperone FliS